MMMSSCTYAANGVLSCQTPANSTEQFTDICRQPGNGVSPNALFLRVEYLDTAGNKVLDKNGIPIDFTSEVTSYGYVFHSCSPVYRMRQNKQQYNAKISKITFTLVHGNGTLYNGPQSKLRFIYHNNVNPRVMPKRITTGFFQRTIDGQRVVNWLLNNFKGFNEIKIIQLTAKDDRRLLDEADTEPFV